MVCTFNNIHHNQTWNYFLKAHMCRQKKDHSVGFDCLSDEQTLCILMFMDPDTLMQFGRFATHSKSFSSLFQMADLKISQFVTG